MTKILLAQKLRESGSGSHKLLDVRLVPGFDRVHIVHREANVIVWSLQVSGGSDSS